MYRVFVEMSEPSLLSNFLARDTGNGKTECIKYYPSEKYYLTRIFSFIQLHLATSNGLEYLRPIRQADPCYKLHFHRPPGLSCLVMGLEEQASSSSCVLFIKTSCRFDPVHHGVLS